MKKFDFVEYLQSGQLETDAQRAITQAIQQAEQAGLPRAYHSQGQPSSTTISIPKEGHHDHH